MTVIKLYPQCRENGGSESSSSIFECVSIFRCMSTCKESPFHPDGNIASYRWLCRWYCHHAPRRSKICAKFLVEGVQAHRCFLNLHKPLQRIILFILGLLSAIKLVADCWNPDVLVDMVASNSCSHGQHESGQERTLWNHFKDLSLL